MSNKRAINLQWPVAGLERKQTFQHPGPYSCSKALNVRTANVWDRRNTGGSRPGTGKYSYTQLGAGAKVNLLSTVDWANSSGNSQIWSDDFEGTSSTVDATLWTQTNNISVTNLTQNGGYANVITSINPPGTTAAALVRGAAFKNIAINTAASYTISAQVDFRTVKAAYSHKVRIYALMDSTTPAPATSGIYAELIMAASSPAYYTMTGALYEDGVNVGSFTGDSTGTVAHSSTFALTIDGTTVTVQWNGAEQLGAGVTITSHGTQVRTGLAMEVSAIAGTSGIQYLLVNSFGFGNTSTSNVDVQTTIVAASNGQLYKDNGIGVMSAVGSAVLDASHYLQTAEHQQRLYIANYSLTDAAQVPKIYDPSAGTVTTYTASTGTLPSRFALITRYSDRIVVGREYANPHLWYMSRKGAPRDWDYTQLALGDNGSAISGASSDASAIGEPLTALIPFGDDYMIMGCSDELWVMRGDPTFAGQIDNLSRKVGIIDKFAWCRTPEGGLLFVSRDGLYYVGPGAEMVPESISREKLPVELLGVDTLQTNICMEFDIKLRGAWIMFHNIEAGQATSWFFDWENKAFWPMQYPLAQEATSMRFVVTPYVRSCLLGCVDGYLREQNIRFSDDDGTALGSYIEIGPIRLAGSEYDEGLLTELIGTPHYNLGTVTWTVKAAKNAQALYNAVSGSVLTTTGTWTTGTDGSALNTKDRQRIRGGAMVLRLEETAGAPWAVESITAALVTGGKQRVSA